MNYVLHSTLRYPPAFGGVETYVRDIVEYSAVPQRVITSDLADHLAWTSLEQASLETRPGHVRTVKAVPCLGRGYPWLAGLAASLRAADVGLIHGHAMYYPSFDLPLLLRTHASVVLNPYAHVRASVKGVAYRKVLRSLVGRADHLVFLTEFEADLFYGCFPSARLLPASIIPPLVRSSQHGDDDTDEDLVVIVGRIDEGKGSRDIPPLCREIVGRRPTTRIQVFGAASELAPWLEEEARESSLHLEVFANADQAQLDAAVRRAAVFVTPSRYEAFGIAAAEAAAAGVSVVGYEDAGALPSVIDRHDDYLGARSRDIKDLADKVLTVLTRPRDQDERRARRTYYTERYGAERWARQWDQLYDSLL